MSELLDRITIEPGKCGGRPCIRGLRVRVIDVLEWLAAGENVSSILSCFPDLEEADIRAWLTSRVSSTIRSWSRRLEIPGRRAAAADLGSGRAADPVAPGRERH
jgi:uncharacterized protein (DUF433 family)